jgi:hypothetical protein
MYRKAWFLFGTVGAFVAVLLLIDAWYVTSRGRLSEHPWVYVALCPTSIVLLGTDRLSFRELSVVCVGIVVTNFLVYAVVGGLVAFVRHLFIR